MPVVPAAISIASADGSGGNGAVVLNQDGSLNTVSNPASEGDIVVIYAAYAGPFANGVKGTDGRTTTGPPYPAPAGTPSVTIGGVAATNIPYFSNAPGFLESVIQKVRFIQYLQCLFTIAGDMQMNGYRYLSMHKLWIPYPKVNAVNTTIIIGGARNQACGSG